MAKNSAPAVRKAQSAKKPALRLSPNQLRARLAAAFNEWMRRYTNEPESFAKEFETIGGFVRDRNEGREPSYGEESAAYLEEIMNQLNG